MVKNQLCVKARTVFKRTAIEARIVVVERLALCSVTIPISVIASEKQRDKIYLYRSIETNGRRVSLECCVQSG